MSQWLRSETSAEKVRFCWSHFNGKWFDKVGTNPESLKTSAETNAKHTKCHAESKDRCTIIGWTWAIPGFFFFLYFVFRSEGVTPSHFLVRQWKKLKKSSITLLKVSSWLYLGQCSCLCSGLWRKLDCKVHSKAAGRTADRLGRGSSPYPTAYFHAAIRKVPASDACMFLWIANRRDRLAAIYFAQRVESRPHISHKKT
jgi:hypothetical protein